MCPGWRPCGCPEASAYCKYCPMSRGAGDEVNEPRGTMQTEHHTRGRIKNCVLAIIELEPHRVWHTIVVLFLLNFDCFFGYMQTCDSCRVSYRTIAVSELCHIATSAQYSHRKFVMCFDDTNMGHIVQTIPNVANTSGQLGYTWLCIQHDSSPWF